MGITFPSAREVLEAKEDPSRLSRAKITFPSAREVLEVRTRTKPRPRINLATLAATKIITQRLQRQIKTTRGAIEKNARHIDFAKNRASGSGTLELLEKNRCVLSHVLQILVKS